MYLIKLIYGGKEMDNYRSIDSIKTNGMVGDTVVVLVTDE